MPNYIRPEELIEPSAFGFNPNMVDVQRRAAIATGGVAGSDAMFRGDEAQDYFKNLFLRNYISDAGQIGGVGFQYQDVLPIEQQYISEILGQDFDPNIHSIVNALGAQQEVIAPLAPPSIAPPAAVAPAPPAAVAPAPAPAPVVGRGPADTGRIQMRAMQSRLGRLNPTQRRLARPGQR